MGSISRGKGRVFFVAGCVCSPKVKGSNGDLMRNNLPGQAVFFRVRKARGNAKTKDKQNEKVNLKNDKQVD